MYESMESLTIWTILREKKSGEMLEGEEEQKKKLELEKDTYVTK